MRIKSNGSLIVALLCLANAVLSIFQPDKNVGPWLVAFLGWVFLYVAEAKHE